MPKKKQYFKLKKVFARLKESSEEVLKFLIMFLHISHVFRNFI